jgi:hypothetical protein
MIAKFDETEELIKKSPPGEENTLINNYIKFIIQNNNNNNNTNNNSKSMVRSSTYKDDNVPFDIKIHNNFQRYNNYDDLNSMQDQQYQQFQYQQQQETIPISITPSIITTPIQEPIQQAQTTETAPAPAAPETFNNYFKSFNEGFKDYYAFNR